MFNRTRLLFFHEILLTPTQNYTSPKPSPSAGNSTVIPSWKKERQLKIRRKLWLLFLAMSVFFWRFSTPCCPNSWQFSADFLNARSSLGKTRQSDFPEYTPFQYLLLTSLSQVYCSLLYLVLFIVLWSFSVRCGKGDSSKWGLDRTIAYRQKSSWTGQW